MTLMNYPASYGLFFRVAICVSLLAGLSCRKESSVAVPSSRRVKINDREWSVELAVTEIQRFRGLSARDNLEEGTGMLFIFPEQEVLEFCMRGCSIPLDIAFIDKDLRIVRICTMQVEPNYAGRETYSSQTPARFALEVRAGELERSGVRTGQKVTFLGDISGY